MVILVSLHNVFVHPFIFFRHFHHSRASGFIDLIKIWVFIDVLNFMQFFLFLSCLFSSSGALNFMLVQIFLGKEQMHGVEFANVCFQTLGFTIFSTLTLHKMPLISHKWHHMILIKNASDHAFIWWLFHFFDRKIEFWLIFNFFNF